MIDALVNLYAKITGVTAFVMDWFPVVAATGSILAVVGGILARAGSSQDPAGFLHSIRPTAEEVAALSLAMGVIKAHFNHKENAAAIANNKPVQGVGQAPPP